MADEVRVVDAFRLAESHAYLARALYPGSEKKQLRAVETMGYLVAELCLTEADRREVWLPKRRAIDSRLHKIERRYLRAVWAAHIGSAVVLQRHAGMTLHRAAQELALALASKRPHSTAVGWSSRTRGTDVIRDVWLPLRASVHFAIPLSLARHPAKHEIVRRHPELVALSVPERFLDLLTVDSWARQAMQVAATWRYYLQTHRLI